MSRHARPLADVEADFRELLNGCPRYQRFLECLFESIETDRPGAQFEQVMMALGYIGSEAIKIPPKERVEALAAPLHMSADLTRRVITSIFYIGVAQVIKAHREEHHVS